MVRKMITVTFFSLVLSFGLALSLASAMAGTPGGKDSAALHSMNSFIGLPVQAVDGEAVGRIDDLIFDLSKNQIGYAVVAMEDRNVVVPWQAVTANHEAARVTLTVDRQTLATAPTMPAEMIDQTFGRDIHEHFGVTPYWTEERPAADPGEAFKRPGFDPHIYGP